MICSDWISIICASISLVVTIVIAGLQLWQSGRMEKFERRQDERDERRHAEEVKSQAVSFISKHYADRGLIPLCAMAAMHNDLYYYSREMYREFCCMTLEAQNRVLEYCGLDLHVTEEKGLLSDALKQWRKSCARISMTMSLRSMTGASTCCAASNVMAARRFPLSESIIVLHI